MRRIGLVVLGLAVAAAWLAGARAPAAPVRPAARAERPDALREPDPPARGPSAAELPGPPPVDLGERLRRLEGEGFDGIEEELEARVVEDPGFAEKLFEAFLRETDPVRMSLLQNAIASDPRLRNDPPWQARFMKAAESDPRTERRAAALLFLQQAESIRTVHDRMLALAENDRELCAHALVALQGLPDRRLPDPRLAELAGRIADREADPNLRGLAVRIEGSPERAARALSDPDRIVRMHAAQVVTAREALEAALKVEEDAEARAVLELRLSTLR